MARAPRANAIKSIASQWTEDATWGIPESPEFSSVQHLMLEFQAHATQEQQWLSGYQALANQSSDPLVRLLLGLIVADEDRHHDLTKRMISKLKDELAWTRSQGLKRRVYEPGQTGKRLLASLEGYIDAERTGIKEYERLRKQSRGLYRDVFALLYSTMIQDSNKHIAILEFLREKLLEGRPSARKRNTG